MEYQQTFTDIRVERGIPMDREDFCHVTVYAPDSWPFPTLLEVEHGRKQAENWQREWLILQQVGASAIRYAIKFLDSYKLGKEIKNEPQP